MAKTIVIDRTHMARRASGIERITDELFSPEALPGLAVESVEAPNFKARIALAQTLGNPVRAFLRPDTIWVFPGFPPSPLFSALRDRSILYVHDLFLITRPADLNRTGKYYMAPMFKRAIGNFRHFFANSETTGRELRSHVAPDATITLYRPGVRNVFGLKPRGGSVPFRSSPGIVVGALGTVEPRKNFLAGAQACRLLSEILGQPVEFHIIGRRGWGADFDALSKLPHVTLHGFLTDEEARARIQAFDLLLCTSHDEGLGLPLLELQYSGLPVVAPDRPVFREVLAASGTYFAQGDADGAAAAMAGILKSAGWRSRCADAARLNLERWNELASADRVRVREVLRDLGAAVPSRLGTESVEQQC